MPPKKLRRRRSSNGRHWHVGTRGGQRGSTQNVWQSHDQRKTRRHRKHWLVTKFPSEDPAAVSAAAAEAVLASATEREDGNALPPCPDDEYASEVLFDAISSDSALSGHGNDGQRFAHLQSIIHTDFGREELGGTTAFWWKIVDEPDTFPPEFWQLFLQSSLTALGEKCRPVCVGMSWRKLIIAGAMRRWRPRLEEVNREVRQFWVAVLGGVEHVRLRARSLHETGN